MYLVVFSFIFILLAFHCVKSTCSLKSFICSEKFSAIIFFKTVFSPFSFPFYSRTPIIPMLNFITESSITYASFYIFILFFTVCFSLTKPLFSYITLFYCATFYDVNIQTQNYPKKCILSTHISTKYILPLILYYTYVIIHLSLCQFNNPFYFLKDFQLNCRYQCTFFKCFRMHIIN